MGFLSIFAAQLAVTALALPTKPATPAGVISAVSLRGQMNAPAPSAVVPAAPATANFKQNMTEDGRGPRGSFYYADSCDDCFYKAALCGCKPAVEYFACLTKHCQASDTSKFADKCAKLESTCFADVDIKCMGPKTTCTSKYSQFPVGGLGISVILEDAEDKAYCGPFGKCIGKFRMKATIHRPAPYGSKVVAAPSPANTSSPVWLECGIPKKKEEKPDFENKEDWVTCQAQASGDVAGCELPMRSGQAIKAEESQKAYCVLTDGQGGKQLTAPTWVVITNAHESTADAKATEDKKEDVPATSATKENVPATSATQSKEPAKADADKKADADNDSQLPWMENNKDQKPAAPLKSR